jgi:hypothetical protein
MLTEKQQERNVPRQPIEQLFTLHDVKRVENGFVFDYPSRWIENYSKLKCIAPRRMEITASEHDVEFGIGFFVGLPEVEPASMFDLDNGTWMELETHKHLTKPAIWSPYDGIIGPVYLERKKVEGDVHPTGHGVSISAYTVV